MTSQKKILVIDDDREFREQMKIILEKNNYLVLEADNEKTALKLAKTELPNLILLDVMMEEVDTGFRLADEIAFSKPRPPVVLISSHADATSQVYDIAAVPVQEFLQKPVDPEYLITMVKKYC
jgi:CheY-like chemotaxis protein